MKKKRLKKERQAAPPEAETAAIAEPVAVPLDEEIDTVEELIPDDLDLDRALLLQDNRDFDNPGICSQTFLAATSIDLDKLNQDDWPKVPITSLFDAQDHQHIGTPLRVVAYISSMSAHTPVRVHRASGVELADAFKITLRDRKGDEIKCFPVRKESYGDDLLKIFESRQPAVFWGTVYPRYVANKSSLYMFSVKGCVTPVSAQDLLQSLHAPIAEVQKVIEREQSKRGGIFRYIRTTLIKHLGIRGLSAAKELSKAIDFMIYQSISDGKDESSSFRLHSLVIGPPNVGKKLLAQIAETLNPVYEEAASDAAKITSAGLVGDVKTVKGVRISNPGLLPRASEGVFCIQDFHLVRGGKRKALFAHLSKLMEEGMVIDSTSARTIHRACAAVHLDQNRLSQVEATQAQDSYSDVNIPGNIISRFDFILDIPADSTRQVEVASDVWRGGADTASAAGVSTDDDAWKWELKAVVAELRERFHTVKVTDDTIKYGDGKIKKLGKKCENVMLSGVGNSLQDSIVRLARSLPKYVWAIAAARFKRETDRSMVDEAFRFIDEKLRFLEAWGPLDTLDQTRESTRDRALRLIQTEFRGKEVTLKEVTKRLQSLPGQTTSERTARRCLKDLIKKRKVKLLRRGVWKVL